MSARNSDASQLTKLKRDRNQAAFFNRINTLQAAAQPGVIVNSVNPQTGKYDSSKMADIANGSYTTYYRASPSTVIDIPCFCSGSDVVVTSRINVNQPIQQPVNDHSPQ